MMKIFLVIATALVLITPLSACGQEATTQEIIDGVIQSLSDINTYHCDMDMSMNMAGEGGGETVDVSMDMKLNAVIDLENAKMKANITMNTSDPDEGDREMAMEMYIIGEITYMMMDIPLLGPMWVKAPMPAGYYQTMGQVKPQVDLLETAQIELLGSETVNGIDCYLLKVTPDIELLWKLALQQMESPSNGAAFTIDEELLSNMLRSYSVKQWFAKDTYFLAKADVSLSLEITPDSMGFTEEEEGSITMDITMILFSYDYNQPVTIELPPEAAEATEFPMGL